jgi:hypothetical protein
MIGLWAGYQEIISPVLVGLKKLSFRFPTAIFFSRLLRKPGSAHVAAHWFSKPSHPSLGHCEKCARAYNDADLRSAFCANCGHPIEIKNEAEHARQRELAELFAAIPDLMKRGFLPSHTG